MVPFFAPFLGRKGAAMLRGRKIKRNTTLFKDLGVDEKDSFKKRVPLPRRMGSTIAQPYVGNRPATPAPAPLIGMATFFLYPDGTQPSTDYHKERVTEVLKAKGFSDPKPIRECSNKGREFPVYLDGALFFMREIGENPPESKKGAYGGYAVARYHPGKPIVSDVEKRLANIGLPVPPDSVQIAVRNLFRKDPFSLYHLEHYSEDIQELSPDELISIAKTLSEPSQRGPGIEVLLTLYAADIEKGRLFASPKVQGQIEQHQRRASSH